LAAMQGKLDLPAANPTPDEESFVALLDEWSQEFVADRFTDTWNDTITTLRSRIEIQEWEEENTAYDGTGDAFPPTNEELLAELEAEGDLAVDAGIEGAIGIGGAVLALVGESTYLAEQATI